MVVAHGGIAAAAPPPRGSAQDKLAAQLADGGDYERALAVIEDGLAADPRNLPLLLRKGTILLAQRDYPAALVAYQAYLGAGATGANRREAQKIIAMLDVVRSTFLDITVSDGPVTIYLDSRTQGVFCVAAPACHKAILPGSYRVIAERAGFERWIGRVTVEGHRTAQLTAPLVESPSLVTVRVAQAGARVAIDGTPYTAPVQVAAGTHRVTVALADHADAQIEIAAHRGEPVALDVTLNRLVAIRLEPPDARLVLDDRPVVPADGRIALPPGPHVAVATAPGFRDVRVEVPAERPADYQLTVELPRIVVARPAGPAPAARSRTRTFAAIGLVAGGGAVLGAGLAFGLKARSTHDEAATLCGTDLICDTDMAATRGHELVRDARSDATVSTVLVAAGGAAIATGVIVWLTAPRPRDTHAVRIVPTAARGDVGLTLAGSF